MSRSKRRGKKGPSKLRMRVKRDTRKGLRALRRAIQSKVREDIHADIPTSTRRREVADPWNHD